MPPENPPNDTTLDVHCYPEPSSQDLSRAAIHSAKKSFWEHPLFQVVMLAVFSGGALFFTLWSDNRNDSRYVGAGTYARDQERFEKQYREDRAADWRDRDAIRQEARRDSEAVTKRLDRQEKVLDDISLDIKSLLKGK